MTFKNQGDPASARLDRLVDLAEVMHIVGFAKTSIYKMMGQGSFPKPVRFGPRMVRWIDREIQEWIQKREHERDSGG